MKYYGFILNNFGFFLLGSCYSEESNVKFYMIAKDVNELKTKMEQKAKKYNLDFEFFTNSMAVPRKIREDLFRSPLKGDKKYENLTMLGD